MTSWAIQSMEFSRPEYWSGYPFPSIGNLPVPGKEPRSPTLQVDSLPGVPPGKPKKAKCELICDLPVGHVSAVNTQGMKITLNSMKR